jgi:hypothetical protein
MPKASRARVALLAGAVQFAASTLVAGPADAALTLRLRDATVHEVVWVLFWLTEQAYVVDSDVVGRVNVELAAASVSDVEKGLAELGVHFNGPAEIRRVSAASAPDLQFRGEGTPISLNFFNGDMDDILRLTMDITETDIVAPAGPLGRVSLFVTEKPAYDVLNAVLAASGLVSTRMGDAIVVRGADEPKAVVLPLNAGGPVGHMKAPHPVVRAVILNNLGNAQLGLRHLDAAEANFKEALAIYRQLQHRAGEGTVLNNLGACAEARSDRARACASYAEALQASLGADDRRGQAITRAHIERIVGHGSADDEWIRACIAAVAE